MGLEPGAWKQQFQASSLWGAARAWLVSTFLLGPMALKGVGLTQSSGLAPGPVVLSGVCKRLWPWGVPKGPGLVERLMGMGYDRNMNACLTQPYWPPLHVCPTLPPTCLPFPWPHLGMGTPPT